MARSYVGEARRRGVGPRTERIGPIVERLTAEHADATIALRFSSDLDLLVSVMLSAQTTDVNVNRVTKDLFRKYRRPEDYLAVPAEELERDIYATGFYRQKTKSIRGAMRVLLEEFDGQVPRTLAEVSRCGPEDGQRRRGRAAIRRASSSTRTSDGSHSVSGSHGRRIRSRSSAICSASFRARTGGGSRTC